MIDNSAYLRASALFPQPVALACGRVARADTLQDRLDAVFKAAETIARYVAALSLASLRARHDPAAALPVLLSKFAGPLSFDNFLSAIQAAHKAECDHPLREVLRAAFAPKPGKPNAYAGLSALQRIRNTRGHNLLAISDALATTIFEEDKPDTSLEEALKACESLLTYPLFVIEEQRIKQGIVMARRLVLMGETADPFPESVELSTHIHSDTAPHVGIKGGVLCVFPYLLWDIVPKRANHGLYFLHSLELDKNVLKYLTSNGDELPTKQFPVAAFKDGLISAVIPVEDVKLTHEESFLSDWLSRRRYLEQALQQMATKIPWSDLDPDTLHWYGHHLGAPEDPVQLRNAIRDQLLDGRDRIVPDEARQIVLLLGKEQAIQPLLRRYQIDLRARRNAETRWDERIESRANVLEGLRLAIEFFGRNLAVDGLTLEGLAATSGSADYIATREALVNVFIHQDFGDSSTVAQVIIEPDRVTTFNAGRSLVSPEALIDGGRSQSRNPIISRALRLIGFAELAGSGLQHMQYAWRVAKRRPPVFQSDAEANTFTMILDWRPMPDISDAFWKRRLGVEVSPEEASVLSLAAESDGVSIAQIASSQGLRMEDADSLARELVRKVLVKRQGEKVVVMDHLRELAREAKGTQ